MKAAEGIKNFVSKDDVKDVTLESKDGVKNATVGLYIVNL